MRDRPRQSRRHIATGGSQTVTRTARRIGVSGSAGTGKTSLGTALAEALDVPFIAEGIRRRPESGLAPPALNRDDPPALPIDLFAESLTASYAAARPPRSFVAHLAAPHLP